MASFNNSLFSTLIKSTGNNIGETGASSLSDALKSNTTLTQIDLSGEDKRSNTQMASINKPVFSILIKSTENYIRETGVKALSDALKSNTTLTQLGLGCKEINVQITSINNPLFHLQQIKRQKRQRHRNNIIV